MAGVVTEYLFSLIAKQVEDRSPGRLVRPRGAYRGRRRLRWPCPRRPSPATTAPSCSCAGRSTPSERRPAAPAGRLRAAWPRPRRPRPDRTRSGGRRHAARPAAARPQHPAVPRRPQRPQGRSSARTTPPRSRSRSRPGKLTLADLDRPGRPGQGALHRRPRRSIFGTGNPQEVALAFLSGDRPGRRGREEGGAAGTASASPSSTFDARPARRCPADRLAGPAGPPRPDDRPRGRPRGRRAPVPGLGQGRHSRPVGVDACVRLARSWRYGRDVRDSYVAAATQGRAGAVSLAQAGVRPRAARRGRDLPVPRAGPAAARRGVPARIAPRPTCSTWPGPACPGSGPR